LSIEHRRRAVEAWCHHTISPKQPTPPVASEITPGATVFWPQKKGLGGTGPLEF